MPLASVSVDLDEIRHYAALHGLSADLPLTAVYDVALERIAEFARQRSLPLTFFVVGANTLAPQNAERLREMIRSGHELGNHTLDHLYDLTRRSGDEQRRQVQGGIDAIEKATGVAPLGFRAPGYTITDDLFDVLESLGVFYDSSVFPCPPYYAAKLAALVGMRVRGRVSRSIVDSPKVLRAPTRPYRTGKPYWTRGSGLLELPVQVTGISRIPFIGTTLSLLGPAGAQFLAQQLLSEPFVNLELHGIDFLDQHDGLAALARHQADLQVPLARKLETFGAVVDLLRVNAFQWVRLDQAVKQLF